MQAHLRNLLLLLTKIKRETSLLNDPVVNAQLRKVDREAKKLRNIIQAKAKK